MNRVQNRILFAAIAAVAVFGACSDRVVGAKTAGMGCAGSGECEPALTCIDMASTFATSNDAGCTGATAHGLSVCTVACEGDDDCSAAGAGLVCAPNGCTTRGYCLPRSDAGATAAKR